MKAALRLVPEWKEYDYEVKVLWDKVYKTNTRNQVEYEIPDIETEHIGKLIFFINTCLYSHIQCYKISDQNRVYSLTSQLIPQSDQVTG